MKKKRILFGDEARTKLRAGIKKIEMSVGSTLGARGRTVLIESEMHTHGITATKDGISVARSIYLEDSTEQLAVRLIKQAASMTATQAGDGTTTSVVLASAMVREADEVIYPSRPMMEAIWLWITGRYKSLSSVNVTELTRNMEIISNKVVENLSKKSREVSGKTLYDVATISANNDPEIGNMIGDAYDKVGENGIVLADNSKTSKTYTTITKGVQFKRPLLSRYHITNTTKMVCELENVAILITDLKIPTSIVIQHLLDYVNSNNMSLLIVGELEKDARETLDYNIHRGLIKACFVNPPSFGDRRVDMMSDLAIATGGNFISERTGQDWTSITFKDLGHSERVVVDMENTSIIHGTDGETPAVTERVSALKKQLAEEEDDVEKEVLNERIANLCGSVATLYVGGKTDVEQKERRDRVDDAVLATKAALEEGILPGGGIALLDEALEMECYNGKDNMSIAYGIMGRALQSPFKQILVNAGKDPEVIFDTYGLGEGVGYDVKKDKSGRMISMGIIDPTKVVRNALINATSVATTILMTSAIITDAPGQNDEGKL